MTENELVGWCHWLDGLESEQARGDGERREVWCAAIHGVTNSQTWQSNWTQLSGLTYSNCCCFSTKIFSQKQGNSASNYCWNMIKIHVLWFVCPKKLKVLQYADVWASLWISKESACNVGDPGLIHGLERSPKEGIGNPLQYYWLENPMDRRAWWATIHSVTKSRTWLTDWHFISFHVCIYN